MNWQQVLDDPALQDLRYKIELNRDGQIIMSPPPSNDHGGHQADIIQLLKQQLPGGRVISECSVETADGVKVPDVAWLSAEFLQVHGLVTPLPRAPEICVEVISPSNSQRQMALKRRLYFQACARFPVQHLIVNPIQKNSRTREHQ